MPEVTALLNDRYGIQTRATKTWLKIICDLKLFEIGKDGHNER